GLQSDIITLRCRGISWILPVMPASGPAVPGVCCRPVSDAGRVSFKAMIGTDLLRSFKLVFPNDALVAVRLAFDAVLEYVPCFGEQANDLEERPLCVLLMRIGEKADRLANGELAGCHCTSQCRVRPRAEKGGTTPRPLYSARSATAD